MPLRPATLLLSIHLTAASAYSLNAVLPQGIGTGCSRARTAVPVSFEEVEEIDPGEVGGLCVLKYPHPLLRAENVPVEKFDYHLKQLAKRMFKLMYASRGVGLAAPQVAINLRLMVVNCCCLRG